MRDSLPTIEMITETIAEINTRGGPTKENEGKEIVDNLAQEIYDHFDDESYIELVNRIRDAVTKASQEGGYLYNSLTSRAAVQPRGYAGDYLTIDGIYAHTDVISRRRLGFHTSDLGATWDRHFLEHPAAQAVRNRKMYFQTWARSILDRYPGKIKLLNIASGPITDVIELYTSLDPKEQARLYIHCIDLDKEAVAYAQQKITSQELAKQISIGRGHALRLNLADKDFHGAWSAGLFDYLDKKNFHAGGSLMKDHVRSGGEIVIGNFNDDHNPSRAYMETFCNWNLIHRTRLQLINLADSIGGFRNVSVGKESEDVNLFLHGIKA